MPNIEDFKDSIAIALLIRKFWEKRTTIALLLLTIGTLGLIISYNMDFSDVANKITIRECIFIIFILVVLFAFWFISRRPPKAEKGKIGIAIAINCETKNERQRLKMDFIDALKEEIRKGNHQQFDIIELSEYHSAKIDPLKPTIIHHNKTRSHLLIYGRCRTRKHSGEVNYVLELNVSVKHRDIPIPVSQGLQQEMLQIFPRKRLFPVSEEVVGFSLTKNIVSYGARYVLGTASLLSMDVPTGFDFHYGLWKEINDELNKNENAHQEYKAIRNLLPSKLIGEGLALTRWHYLTKRNNYLEKAHSYLKIVQDLDPNNYAAHLLMAIYHFTNSRDIDSAKNEIKKARNERDSAWQYSEAFLLAYESDLVQAHKVYQRAFRGNVDPFTTFDVESFILEVLDKEPKKIQLWYCVGMINYFDKEDFSSAKNYFSKFVTLAKASGQFTTSVPFAEKYIEETKGKTSRKEKM